MSEKINLDLLMNMGIPEITQDGPASTELTEEDINETKQDTIDEVESSEEFQTLQEPRKKEVKDTQPLDDADDEETELEPETKEVETPEVTESPVKVLAEWAAEKGFIEFDAEKFEDTEDYLENLFSEKINKEVETWKSSLPEEINSLITNYQEGVPLDEIIYSRSREIEYNGIKEDSLTDDEKLQERLVTEWMQNNDPEVTPDEISKEIKALKDTLRLEDKAKTSLLKLQKFEKRYQENLIQEAREKQIQNERQFETILKGIEKRINDSDEIIKGYKMSPEEKKKLIAGYTKFDSKKKTQLMKIIESDPDAQLKIAQLFLVHGGDFENIKTKLKTTVAKETREVVNTYKETSPLNKLDLKGMKKTMEKLKRK